MIYFVTTRNHYVNHPDIQIISSLEPVKEYLLQIPYICYDKEFNGLNPFYSIPLLTQVGDENNQYVIDDYSFPDLSWLCPYREKEHVGHNIKIDMFLSRIQGYEFENVYDTMLVEQRVGQDSKRENSLEATAARRINKQLNKVTRNEFTEMGKGAIFENEHILYSAQDIAVLPAIRKVQEDYIKKYNMEFLMQDIEFPLVSIINEMEYGGINIIEEKWLENIEDSKKALFKVERELDDELRALGFKIPIRNRIEVTQNNLFDAFGTTTVNKNKHKAHVNFSSSLQILQIFDRLGLTPPSKLDKSKDKATGQKSYEEKDSVQESAINTYLLDNPKSPFKPFLLKYIEFKGIEKEINSFGYKFIKTEVTNKTKKRELGFKNRITGRVHTSYRQCSTANSRLASGDSKIGFFNSQQIPQYKKFREAFSLSPQEIADDWWITTADLTGAEVVIMAAFAKDEQLREWAILNDDLHSPMATACWRAVYEYRNATYANAILNGTKVNDNHFVVTDLENNKYVLTADFVVNKKNNTQMRIDFKSVTFGVVYGAEAKTISKYLNIPVKEAQVIINTIKDNMKATFKMVEGFAHTALHEARIVHNKRTNSHKWFMPAMKGFSQMESGEMSAISGEARNCPISGTQADMVKEAMVEIRRYFRKHNIKHRFIFQIHDELVVAHQGKEHGAHVARIMSEVGTKYLEGFAEMGADYKTLTHWTK